MKRGGRNASRYTLGRAFYEYLRLDKNGKSNNTPELPETASRNVQKPQVEQALLSKQIETNTLVTLSLVPASRGHEREIAWSDIRAAWDRIPGISAESPAELEDLPRDDFQPLYDWLKDGPTGLTAKPAKKAPRVCVMGHAEDCAHNGCDHVDHNDDDEDCDDEDYGCDVSCDCSCCDCYEERVTPFFSDGIRDHDRAFTRAGLYHRHGLAFDFLDRMLNLYAELGGSAVVLGEIDKCLNRKAVEKVPDIRLPISNWLGRAAQWQRESDEEREQGREGRGGRRGGQRGSKRPKSGDGGWGDTLAARRAREELSALPNVP